MDVGDSLVDSDIFVVAFTDEVVHDSPNELSSILPILIPH